MNNNIQLSLDDIANVNAVIDPNKLICSLCYCINKNLMQCKNSHCGTLFCGTCFDSLVKNRKLLCPFCRTDFDYTFVNEELTNIINGLQFFCKYHFIHNKVYNYDEYFQIHNEKCDSEYICSNHLCKTKNNWAQVAKCNICAKFYCENNLTNHCLRKCYGCLSFICINCNKTPGEFLCGDCDVKCYQCNGEAIRVCNLCNRSICSNCSAPQCPKCEEYSCTNCEKNLTFVSFSSESEECLHKRKKKKSSLCSICSTLPEVTKCNICSISVCRANCIFKCKNCSKPVCNLCSSKCSICKKRICLMCYKTCSQCVGSENKFVSCLKCNSDTLSSCSTCQKTLCINCWNSCNTCNKIFCSSHCYTCLNCEEKMCNEHYSTCRKCNKDNKLCLKKCTFKCSFCNNMTNALCKKANHTSTYVTQYNCEHNICYSCIKTCYVCKTVVISCPKCIVNYYFCRCNYCQAYLCRDCARVCKTCEDYYCTLVHHCTLCGKFLKSSACTKCLFNMRKKCILCERKIPQSCEKCNQMYICGPKCYFNYVAQLTEGKIKAPPRGHLSELSEMFICKAHFKEKETKGKLKKMISEIEKKYKNDNKRKDSCEVF